jgi:hypothetical protein
LWPETDVIKDPVSTIRKHNLQSHKVPKYEC